MLGNIWLIIIPLKPQMQGFWMGNVSVTTDSMKLIIHHAQHIESNYASATPGYSKTFLIKNGWSIKATVPVEGHI